MDKVNINLVDKIKKMNIFLSQECKDIVSGFRSDPGSPLSESETFSNQIDVALYIFFNAVGPENKQLSVDKINSTKRKEIAKKSLELPLSSSKISNIAEIIIATYLALNPREDLVKVMNQDIPKEQNKEIEQFILKVKSFIENTIETYASQVSGNIYEKVSTDSTRPTKHFVRKIRNNQKTSK
ncbi:hypothetical protein HN450_03735 [bacterium]|jgi:hypothetical protein|nr:hypothetical protein [bacterium]MBT3850420.1 hypothetical protein [bacterium]